MMDLEGLFFGLDGVAILRSLSFPCDRISLR